MFLRLLERLKSKIILRRQPQWRLRETYQYIVFWALHIFRHAADPDKIREKPKIPRKLVSSTTEYKPMQFQCRLFITKNQQKYKLTSGGDKSKSSKCMYTYWKPPPWEESHQKSLWKILSQEPIFGVLRYIQKSSFKLWPT